MADPVVVGRDTGWGEPIGTIGLTSLVGGGGLIGRGSEVERILALLTGPAGSVDSVTRLVTLTGPGGVGKSRLAERVAASCTDDGGWRVVSVALAAVGEPEGVLPAVARRLGISPDSGGSPRDAVAAELRGGDGVLLVLDNLEHLPGVDAVVEDLLQGSPHLRILATSRVRLRLRAETAVPVAPLETPEGAGPFDPLALGRVPAVTLFVRRMREVYPAFMLTAANAGAVAAVCQRLDGLPLGIELVASRGRSLSLDEMLARLKTVGTVWPHPPVDTPERHRSLDASIAWSVGLLPAETATGLARLAVFAGGFDLAGARDVAGIDEGDLELLLDHHLIERLPCPAGGSGVARFGMREPVRQFGLDRLREAGAERETRDRHATAVRAVVERLAPIYRGAEGSTALADIARHLDDIFAALAWTTTTGDLRVGAAIATAMLHPWVVLIDWETSHRWVHRVLGAARAAEHFPLDLTARVRHTAAMVSYHAERLDESVGLCAEAAIAARLGDDRVLLGHVLAFWCQTLRATGDLDRAGAVEAELLALAEELDTPALSLEACAASASLALFQSDFDRADRMARDAIRAARRLGLGHTVVANHLSTLGYVAALQGDFSSGRAYFAEALALHASEGDTHYFSMVWGLARLELLAGDGPTAALGLADVLGGRLARRETQRVRDALLDTARLAWLVGRPAVAARLFGAVESETAPLERNRLMAGLWRAAETDVRAALGATAFRVAYRQGQVLSLERAVAEAVAFTRVVAAGSPRGVGRPVPLTTRELDVVRLVMAGKSDREIGDALFISPQTASTHVKNILRKMGVSSRTAAVTVALGLGLIDGET